MDLISTLTNLNLSENEAKIYLSLIQIGRGTAYSISRNSGLNKSTVYGVLNQLSEKGFIKKIPRVRKKIYKPLSVVEAIKLAEDRLNTVKQKKKELIALEKKGSSKKVRVSYFEGIKAVSEAMDKVLEKSEGKEIIGFGTDIKGLPPELIKKIEKWYEKKKKLKVRSRIISPRSKGIEKYTNKDFNRKYLVKMKKLSKEIFESQIGITVYKQYVLILSFRFLQGIMIENPDIAKTMRQIHKIVWRKG